MLGGLVDTNMKRTVHRLQPELRLLKLSWCEHRIGVGLFMTACPPQFTLGNMRRVHQAIATLVQLSTQIVFHFPADRAALRVPEDQPLPVLLLNREEIEFATQA